nr:MAG TPA: hypothetical protein [Bacteriophage sp.]
MGNITLVRLGLPKLCPWLGYVLGHVLVLG